mgnify:FL=1|jgi:hypothetical protein
MLALLVKSSAAVASAHLALSCTCLANSALLQGNTIKGSTTAANNHSDAEAKRSQLLVAQVRTIVNDMYSGKGILQPEMLSPKCMFVDPIAICTGREEVVEVFRALQFLSPQPVMRGTSVEFDQHNFRQTPRLLNVVWQKENNKYATTISFELEQSYFNRLQMTSLLIVDVEVDDEFPELSELSITSFEEKWNYRSLFNFIPFTTVRWINGKMSYYLTPLLLPGIKEMK